jgi:AmmeMemoRadiSam system protein B
MKKIIQLLFILFIFSISTVPVLGGNDGELSIVSGVVPHHLLAKEIMVDFFEFVSKQEQHPETIVLLSPDHFNCSALQKENSFISIDWETDDVKLNEISVNYKLLKELSINNKIKPTRSSVLAEFGITNLLPLIKEYLPKTKIVPIIIPEGISREQTERLVHSIHEITSPRVMLVASVDFSHYLPPGAAAFHDAKSIRVLLNFEEEHFKNIEVDSWQSLHAVRLFAKLRESEKSLIVAHKNSVDFLPCDFNSTTSYFSVVFQKGKENKYIKIETVLLAGDMMLDRGMEELIKQNSIYYPFLNIVQLLRGVDVVFANLEGPVVQTPQAYSTSSLIFSSHPNILEGMRWSKINLLSIANNHIYDMGKEGLEETKSWLQEYRINFVGSPFSGSTDKNNNPAYSEQSIFLSFNRVLPYIDYQREIIKEVQKVRQSNPGKFIIVSMHWGNEYELTSSPVQRELAQRIITAGADIIVGHHPHVVQEIELIQDKPVFYSLGNFIFDQQVMPETKEGLAVGLTISSDKLTFRLFPIKNQSGQPILMSQNEAKLFLKNLAEKSDKRLWENIKKGIIESELVD